MRDIQDVILHNEHKHAEENTAETPELDQPLFYSDESIEKKFNDFVKIYGDPFGEKIY